MMKQWQWYESIRIKHLFALSCFLLLFLFLFSVVVFFSAIVRKGHIGDIMGLSSNSHG